MTTDCRGERLSPADEVILNAAGVHSAEGPAAAVRDLRQMVDALPAARSTASRETNEPSSGVDAMSEDPSDQRVGQARTSAAAGGMFSAMKTIAAMWMDPGMVDDDQIPARFSAGTLVLWTAAGVILSAAVSAADVVISGGVSLLSLVAALTMFLPSAMAFLAEPPRRGLGLGLGGAAGTVCGAVAVAFAGGGVLTLHWSLFLGLSVGALVGAFTFGRLTWDTDPPPAEPLD